MYGCTYKNMKSTVIVLLQFAPWNQLDTEKAGVDQVTRAKYVKIHACTHAHTHTHTHAHVNTWIHTHTHTHIHTCTAWNKHTHTLASTNIRIAQISAA